MGEFSKIERREARSRQRIERKEQRIEARKQRRGRVSWVEEDIEEESESVLTARKLEESFLDLIN